MTALAIAALIAVAPMGDAGADRSIPVWFSGAVTVEFRGDPAAGCAIAGVCGFEGTVTWTPDRRGNLSVEGGSAWLSTGDSSFTTARVTRHAVDGSTGRCEDRRRTLRSSVAVGSAPITLPGSDLLLDTFATRCAGPLQADVQGALPAARLDPAALRGRRIVTLDLRWQRPFAAGGFAGTVRSTIVARVGRPRPPWTPTLPPRRRTLTVRYAIDRIDGIATTTFVGAVDPARCRRLDACGASGTVTAVPGPPQRGELTITATAGARRPWRDLRTALGLARGGRTRGILLEGSGTWEGGTATASVHRPEGGPPCSDSAPLSAGSLTVFGPDGRLRAFYPDPPDALRTRCPGPRQADVVPRGGQPPSVEPPRVVRLRGSRQILRLTRDRGFSTPAYAGRMRGDLRFHLRRTSVTASASPASPTPATAPMRALPGRPSLVATRDHLELGRTASLPPAALLLWALSGQTG